MLNFNNLKVKTKMLLLISVFIFGFVILGLFAITTINTVKVGGPLYEDINRSKGVYTDLVPPAMALNRNFLATFRMQAEKDPAALQELIERNKSFRTENEKAHENWAKQLPDGKMKDFVTETSRRLTQEFFDVQDKEFIPAILQGDRVKSQGLIDGKLRKIFEDHDRASKDAIKIGQDQVEAFENTAASTAWWRNVYLLIASTVIIIFSIILGWLTSSSVGRIKGVVERVEKLRSLCVTNLGRANDALSVGDLKFEVVTGTEFLNDTSQDDIGELARSIDGIITQTQTTIASFEKSRLILRDLIDESKLLTTEALNGNINVRGEASKYQGGYRELIAGMNSSFEAMASPISEASECLQRVAERDLTAKMKGDYKGEFAKMKDALNTALDNLDEGLIQVSSGAEQVASASHEISSGSQSLAQGASEQASTLEEISSSLLEISSMTKQNTDNSKEARSLSDNARVTAENGMKSMLQLSAAVDKIKASSDSTAKIVKTIEEIAFQTNLLALNAAVEAARAGDAGKGFAVVAEEVRNLAMRSAEAAKTTAQLIEESVKNTESGVAYNAEVSTNLQEINRQIEKVNIVVTEIAAASEQQSQGVDQITIAIEQMNGATQQTAANSEESASAAEELSGQSQEMLSLIGEFKLSSQRSDSRRPKAYSNGRADKPMPAMAVNGNGNGFKRKNGNGHSSKIAFTAASSLIPFDDASDSALSDF